MAYGFLTGLAVFYILRYFYFHLLAGILSPPFLIANLHNKKAPAF